MTERGDSDLPPISHSRLSFAQKCVQSILFCLPPSLRRKLYQWCTQVFPRPFPTLKLYRLPFSLVLKIGNPNEGKALAILHALGAVVNHPALFDCITTHKPLEGYIVTSWIHGDNVGHIWENLTLTDKRRLELDLREQCAALRSCTGARGRVICSADGGSVVDFRLPWLSDNPRTFEDCMEFASQVWIGLDHHWIPECVALRPVMLPIIQRTNVPITLCHGDIVERNMVFPGGLQAWREGRSRLCSIDWEQAAWMPEYWDAVKATFPVVDQEDEWLGMMQRVFVEFLDVLEADWEWRSRSRIEII